ncbi:MAG TPA: hypothetical protein ENK43_03850 [Planctomycetes bacterium]|nr:hypothetical protein [Planctomycetota bacterium]
MIRKPLFPVLLICALIASSSAQSTGPDVIVGELPSVSNYAHVGSIEAYSIATTSCNIGDQTLNWLANVNQHPVIAQHLYRVRNGVFDQIGQSWLKHGFAALAGSVCDTCQNPGTTTVLGVGCSDPYGSSLNGSQSGLGPKDEVNAFTGAFAYPFRDQGMTGNSIYKRLQVHVDDVNPALNAGASYFIEGHYVTPDDAQAGNHFNNASWREVTFSPSGGGFNMAIASGSQTHREEPAILAWPAIDPGVQVVAVDVPGEGRFYVGFNDIDNGDGTHRYVYAVHNLNSDRSGGSFSVPMPTGATVTNITFHDVDYHSGVIWDGTDWPGSFSGGSVSWATTQTFAQNANANALRWGTCYTFSFTSDMAPGQPTLGLFKPGSPTSVTVPVGPPAFAIGFPNGVPATVQPDQTNDIDVQVTNQGGAPDPATAQLYVAVDGAAFTASPMQNLGNGLFRGTLPAVSCLSRVDFYVSIDVLGGGGTITAPVGAPANFHSAIASPGALAELFHDDFESDLGWTVQNDASLTDGAWDRGVPVGGGDRGDPLTDSDGSGQCYLTDNVDGNSDVDGGATRLISPPIDLFATDALISFDFWYDNNFGANPGQDVFEIHISNDGGASWTLVEAYNANTDQWNHRQIRVSDYVTPSADVRMRFTASDFGGGSVVEAGLDAFVVETCPIMDPVLAAGNIGVNGAGGPFDVLQVNGSTGGILRRVISDLNQPLSFSVTQVPTNPNPSSFAIFGMAGHPGPGDAFDIGFGIGTMVLIPCPADALNPGLFILTDNFGGASPCQPVLGSSPAPWTLTYAPGLPIEVEFTLQALVVDPTGAFSLGISNAVNFRTIIGAP